MEISIFEFYDYKVYINTRLQFLPGKGYGFKAQIARAAGCNSAYVTQVLNKNAHFSLEQAEALNSLLSHDRDEAEYFLSIVQYARANSKALRDRFKIQIERIKQARLSYKVRLDIRHELSEPDQVRYYSSWYFAAIHMATTIPELQSELKIAEALGLSKERVTEVLEFLISAGLVKRESNRLRPGISRIFLGRDAMMTNRHHVNWRAKAIETLDHGNSESFHLSTVLSLASEDLVAFKEQLNKGVEKARTLARASKEEELHCLNVDFFRVDHGRST